jgi:Tol biopolymer transport system component
LVRNVFQGPFGAGRAITHDFSTFEYFDHTGFPNSRLTTSARTEFVRAPVWSPDGRRIAYAAMRAGQEGFYVRAANGQGPEELLYKPHSAFLNLSDWSMDGRFVCFADAIDVAGAKLYVLPLDGNAERKPVEVFRSSAIMVNPKFSPDGRFVSYRMGDNPNRLDLYVRPVDPASGTDAWKIAEGIRSAGFWRPTVRRCLTSRRIGP